MEAYRAVVSGGALRYSHPTPGYIVLLKVCVRDGCVAKTSELVALCPVLLQKPKEQQL
jgi:hypothetical protein